MLESVEIYSCKVLDKAFRQGEILTGLQQVVLDVQSIGKPGDPLVNIVRHDYTIVVSQDCDLDSDYLARSATGERPPSKLVAGVLLCEVEEATATKSNTPSSKLWEPIRSNRNERYHFLQAVSADQDALGESLPELVVDFKRYFTIPAEELYARLKHGLQRRTRLVNPYLAHFANRFANFQSRVALPVPHQSE